MVVFLLNIFRNSSVGFLGGGHMENVLSQNFYMQTLEANLIHLGKKRGILR